MSNLSITTSCTGSKYKCFKYNLPEAILALSQDLNLKPTQIKTVNQVHGDNICIITDPSQDTSKLEADCIITKLKNICIGAKTADCIPVTLYDPINEVIACIHLGRKSLLLGLFEKTINLLITEYGSDPSLLKIWIYPSLLQPNHSIVSTEADKFPSKFVQYLPKGNLAINNKVLFEEYLANNNLNVEDMQNHTNALVDTHSFLIEKMAKCGILDTNITDSNIDTFEDKNYHSYRRDYPNQSLMLSYIIMNGLTI
jgi:polyphenol oxidase